MRQHALCWGHPSVLLTDRVVSHAAGLRMQKCGWQAPTLCTAQEAAVQVPWCAPSLGSIRPQTMALPLCAESPVWGAIAAGTCDHKVSVGINCHTPKMSSNVNGWDAAL
jgi:hypothetical protein